MAAISFDIDVTPAPTDRQDRGWQALRYFCFYRIVIAGLFAVLALLSKLPPNFTDFNVKQLLYSAGLYLALAIVVLIAAERRWGPIRYQVYAQVLIDITCLTLFIHASGGVGGGFGLLLVVAIAGGCLFVRPKGAVFFAALASLVVLMETILGVSYYDYEPASYTQAGLLGAALFGTALLASILAEQVRRSEELAAERAVDIENLSRLNEHIVQRMRSGIVVLDHLHKPVLSNAAAAQMLSGDDRYGQNMTALHRR